MRRPAGHGSGGSEVRSACKPHGAYTLVETLVVIAIILVVSAVALPTVFYSMSHRQVSEAARILQAGLAGTRD
jgi:prepilin-type N-terminal cleavage/methylation domain-containing protein